MESHNKYMVAVCGDRLLIMNAYSSYSKDEALNLAAWLFVLSGKTVNELETMIKDVEES